MRPPPTLEIQESRTDGCLRLSLIGELDLAVATRLEDRLAPLRARRTAVKLDLSRLLFIDSTGIRLLIQTIGDARIKRWDLQIDPNVSPQVMRLFRLVHLDRFVFDPAPAPKR
jgi:anti-anti-sigma factor